MGAAVWRCPTYVTQVPVGSPTTGFGIRGCREPSDFGLVPQQTIGSLRFFARWPYFTSNSKRGMSHTFRCHTCSLQLSVSDKVFEDRIAGKRVTISCKNCNTPMIEVGSGQTANTTKVQGEAAPPLAPAPPLAAAIPLAHAPSEGSLGAAA